MKTKTHLIRRIFSDNQYEWMLKNLPLRLMYVKVPFDGTYVWRPRFGFTDKQISEAQAKADELSKGLNWE